MRIPTDNKKVLLKCREKIEGKWKDVPITKEMIKILHQSLWEWRNNNPKDYKILMDKTERFRLNENANK